jgi:hypothetical protein
MFACRYSGSFCAVAYWPGKRIWSWTMFAIALSSNPSERACANASSRFGPIVDVEPTAASA